MQQARRENVHTRAATSQKLRSCCALELGFAPAPSVGRPTPRYAVVRRDPATGIFSQDGLAGEWHHARRGYCASHPTVSSSISPAVTLSISPSVSPSLLFPPGASSTVPRCMFQSTFSLSLIGLSAAEQVSRTSVQGQVPRHEHEITETATEDRGVPSVATRQHSGAHVCARCDFLWTWSLSRTTTLFFSPA